MSIGPIRQRGQVEIARGSGIYIVPVTGAGPGSATGEGFVDFEI